MENTNSNNPPIIAQWTSLREYPDILRLLGKNCNLGISVEYICKLYTINMKQLHFGQPIAIDIWSDGNLYRHWEKAISCLKFRLKMLGFTLQINFDPRLLAFLPGSERDGKVVLTLNPIDITTFDSSNGDIIPSDILSTKSSWPGLDIIWLMAFNPSVCIKLGGKIPYLLMPGLTLPSGFIPNIYTVGNTVCIDSDRRGKQMQGAVMPAYAESNQN
jgi:hypothetical protein